MDVKDVQRPSGTFDPQAIVQRLGVTVDLVRTLALQAHVLTRGVAASGPDLASFADSLGQLQQVAQDIAGGAAELAALDQTAETIAVLRKAAHASRGVLAAATGVHALICRALADAAAVVEEQSAVDGAPDRRLSSRHMATAAQSLQDAMNQLAL